MIFHLQIIVEWYCAVQEKSARTFRLDILMIPFSGLKMNDESVQKSCPKLMGHFSTSRFRFLTTSIKYLKKFAFQKCWILKVGTKIHEWFQVFVGKLCNGFWFGLKSIFPFHNKKITSKFYIFKIVGLTKNGHHYAKYSKMAFSKSNEKRFKITLICSKMPLFWVWSWLSPVPRCWYTNESA